MSYMHVSIEVARNAAYHAEHVSCAVSRDLRHSMIPKNTRFDTLTLTSMYLSFQVVREVTRSADRVYSVQGRGVEEGGGV